MLRRNDMSPGSGAGLEDHRYVTLVSASATPCGVEAFARRLSAALKDRSVAEVLDRDTGRGRSSDPRAVLVVNLPVVAWKKRLAAPVLAAVRMRLAGRRVAVILHEWRDLDWKRRASYLPLLLLADTVLFSCPFVARTFGRSVASALTTRARGVVPIPPNVSRPAALRMGAQGERVGRERASGRTVLGHFGSIYPRKRSTLVLDVAAEMKARGERPFVVFAGSFIQGRDAVEREFFAHVRRLGLDDDVLVTGFMAEEEELFGLLAMVDVFVYSFTEGLSSRRASVLACLTAGKPVVVNAPRDVADFDHHPAYRTLLASGLLRLVPTEAGAGVIADAVRAARDAAPVPPPIDVDAAWASAVESLVAAVSARSSGRGPRGHALPSWTSRALTSRALTSRALTSKALAPAIDAVARDARDVPARPAGGLTP